MCLGRLCLTPTFSSFLTTTRRKLCPSHSAVIICCFAVPCPQSSQQQTMPAWAKAPVTLTPDESHLLLNCFPQIRTSHRRSLSLNLSSMAFYHVRRAILVFCTCDGLNESGPYRFIESVTIRRCGLFGVGVAFLE